MRVVSYNILNGGVGRADPVAEVLEAQRADVIVLPEADDDWVVERISRRMEMEALVGSGRGGHRLAVLSRWPVLRSVNEGLLNDAGPRCVVAVEVGHPTAGPVTLIGVHLSAGATLAAEAVRVGEVRAVLALATALRESGRPHLLAGDFNANTPAQRIDPARCKPATRQAFIENGNRIPRDAMALLLATGYADTLATAHGDAARDAATFTTHEPGQRVDYVFAHGLCVRDAWIETDRLATYASDHYPVGAELDLPAATRVDA